MVYTTTANVYMYEVIFLFETAIIYLLHSMYIFIAFYVYVLQKKNYREF